MARQTRGNGTVYQRGNVWWFQYFLGGRKINESSGSTDEAEARRQLQVKLGEKAGGNAVVPSRATIADLCALVIENHRLRQLHETKVVEYQFHAHIEPILGSLRASRLGSLFVCGYHTGARKGELLRIQWPQVDFKAGLIRLAANQTKNGRPRTLPIYGDMRRWLEHQRETSPEGSEWVFHGAQGCPVDSHLNGWKDACKRAGVPNLLFHDLRRSAVRNMKKAGLQDLEAMRISGHLTRAIFDRYNIIDEEDLANAGKRLEEYAQKRKQERVAKLRRVK